MAPKKARKDDISEKTKRVQLGNLTNNVEVTAIQPEELDAKTSPKMKKPSTQQQVEGVLDVKKINGNAAVTVPPTKIENNVGQNRVLTRSAAKRLSDLSLLKVDDKKVAPEKAKKKKPNETVVVATATKASENGVSRFSNESNQTEETLGMSALEDNSNCDSSLLEVDDKKVAPDVAKKTKTNEPVAVATAAKANENVVNNESNQTEETLNLSTLGDISNWKATRSTGNSETAHKASVQPQPQQTNMLTDVSELKTDETSTSTECVENFDNENFADSFSYYTIDIINYVKKRENDFPIDDYMKRQPCLTASLRTLLIDCMFQVHQKLHANSESLFLAVKVVDHVLCRKTFNIGKLHLLGDAALCIACKLYKRQHLFVSSFLFVCNGSYTRQEFLAMEMETLRTINFDLSIPTSYWFLRGYAHCAKVPIPTVDLARNILELSLMDYEVVGLSDSHCASAALYIALRMHNADQTDLVWTPSLKYYSGYDVADIADTVRILNDGLHRNPKEIDNARRMKHYHKILRQIVKVPLLSNRKLVAIKSPWHVNNNPNNQENN